jgi:nucleotide-binding universal stress UspA family protein
MAPDACIVCGTDLSERARPALEAAAALAATSGAELWVVHVVDPATEGGRACAAAGGREAPLAAWRGDVGSRSGSRVRQAVLVGPAAETLASLAEARRASAVVVSSQGHGAEPLFKLGGTSERIAVECPVPVLVVRDAAPFARWARREAPLRVLLAVDFTESSDSAIRFARFLRAAGPTELTVGHVFHPGVSSRYGLEPLEIPDDPDASVEALLRRDLERLVGDLGGDGPVVYRPYQGEGRIGDHVLEMASDERAALVVVGTRRKRGYRRLASVSSVILHHGKVSVACAPRVAP